MANLHEGRYLWSIFGQELSPCNQRSAKPWGQSMAGSVKHARLESASARSRLKRGRQPHWQALAPGAHLGWQRGPKDHSAGRWLLRLYRDGSYSTVGLGKADDAARADGLHVLDFASAQFKARAMLAAPGKGKVQRMTVRQAAELYLDHKRSLGADIVDPKSRIAAHILPTLGNLVVEDIEAARLRRWLADMAEQPPQLRPTGDGKPQWKAAPKTEEDKRRRRNTANRVLNIFKAMLNHAHDEGHVADASAWGRKLKPLKDAEGARLRYLDLAECKRLMNACEIDFRDLCRAALETGARYSELTRLQVRDFNKDAGTVTIAKSKSGKARHVVLTADGSSFFKSVCLGRDGGEVMLTKASGEPWQRSDQKKRIDAVCAAARIKPRITFHGLRHTWASLSIMAGAPLLVVARNLGHADTRMVERHYGHLAPSFIADAIRENAPRFGKVHDRKIVPLR
jgi:integrase